MTTLMAPGPVAGSEIFERILAVPGGLVLLDCDDSAALVEQFRAIARHSGQSIYLWDPEAGMGNLREVHARVPGLQRLGNALRYMQQSNHFGIYLLAKFPLPISTMDNNLLRQLARSPAGHVRRVVLLDAEPALVAGLDDVAVRLDGSSRSAQRPRLRDGRWLP
ncbi:hypothetical protein CS053_10555 [Rhodanobacter glycinis]|uniref:Uncharacterized protein n=2 Tax=Rhodanobacter glycinis TaxID=582702 RepID=A0A5B9E1Q1_9GAMM|nr:hypothetical protein CS053_10555 [Rhodanobacter glycinis]